MTMGEYLEWFIFYQKEPWGYHVESWRMGMICATVANAMAKPKQPFSPADFIPDASHKPQPEQDMDDQMITFRSMMTTVNN